MEKLSESSMEWLGLKILPHVIDGSIVIPKDYTDINENDECINDIGFAIAHTFSDKQLVQFFKQLGEHSQPFASINEYVECVGAQHDLEESWSCDPNNQFDNNAF